MSDADILDVFLQLGLAAKISDLVFTAESVEDYRHARSYQWSEPGRLVVDEPGLFVVENVRPQPFRALRKVIVKDFGASRVVAGAEVRDRNRGRFARALA